MKATIVKNDKFETIGVEILGNNNEIVFTWGIAPVVSMYFIKEIDTQKFENQIIELVRLNAEISLLDNFSSLFFDVALASGAIKCNSKGVPQAFNFEKIKKEKTMLENKKQRIIDSFI